MNLTTRIAQNAVAIALVVTALPQAELCAQSLSAAIGQLQNSNYAVRKAGFYRILALATGGSQLGPSLRPRCERLAQYSIEHPETRPALIAVLERENRPDPSKGSLSEDPYYGDLIGCVAEFKDPRAVNALIGAVQSGRMAQDGLVALGQTSVPGLLANLRSSRYEFARASSAGTLGLLAARRGEMPVDTAAIEAGLIKALSDRSIWVRRASVDALSQFSSQKVRTAITILAQSDTAVLVLPGRREYPVRAAAIKWVRRDDSLRVVRGSH